MRPFKRESTSHVPVRFSKKALYAFQAIVYFSRNLFPLHGFLLGSDFLCRKRRQTRFRSRPSLFEAVASRQWSISEAYCRRRFRTTVLPEKNGDLRSLQRRQEDLSRRSRRKNRRYERGEVLERFPVRNEQSGVVQGGQGVFGQARPFPSSSRLGKRFERQCLRAEHRFAQGRLRVVPSDDRKPAVRLRSQDREKQRMFRGESARDRRNHRFVKERGIRLRLSSFNILR